MRRLTVTAMRVADEKTMARPDADTSQLELFVDCDKLQSRAEREGTEDEAVSAVRNRRW